MIENVQIYNKIVQAEEVIHVPSKNKIKIIFFKRNVPSNLFGNNNPLSLCIRYDQIKNKIEFFPHLKHIGKRDLEKVDKDKIELFFITLQSIFIYKDQMSIKYFPINQLIKIRCYYNTKNENKTIKGIYSEANISSFKFFETLGLLSEWQKILIKNL